MKILQVLPELNVGGVETGTVDLARHLVRLGHKVVVVSNGGELVRELEACGAVHYQLPVHNKSLFSIFKTIPKLAEIIRKEEIDIVHARSRAPGWIAYFACRRTSRTFITTCHGYYSRHFFSSVMGWGKRVIVLSNAIARHMVDDFGVPHERIRLIPRSVDAEKFRYISPDTKRKEEFNVGIVGRVTPIKGHLYFIKAMAKVARLQPRIKIWIVGDAPASRQGYKEQVQVLVKRLGLWHCTEFLGTQRDIPSIMANLDVLVLATTTQEAFGRVIIEAQAAGVPVVATKVGGVVDVIDDGKTGLLVPPADPAGIAEAVIRLMKDKPLAAMLAEAAYKKVKDRYGIAQMVEKTLEVYKEALENFNLLVIKFSSLGDIILSTAAIRALREKFSAHYKITFLVGEKFKETLLRCPYIDELLVCDFKNKDKGIAGLFRLGCLLRSRNFDLAVDLQNNRKSHLLAWFSSAPARYGYKNKKLGSLLNCGIIDDRPSLEPVAHQFRILKPLGIELKDQHLELWPSEDDRDYVDSLLQSEWVSPVHKLVGINISASPRWQSKAWPISSLLSLCQELSRKEFRVVLTGTEEDAKDANFLVSASRAKDAKPINACGKTTVNQLACLIKKCSVYITPDSAPLHIAASMGTPFVALFGPTDSRRHLPPAKKYVVLEKAMTCSPCYKPKCGKKKCMELIRPEEVLAAVEKLLKD